MKYNARWLMILAFVFLASVIGYIYIAQKDDDAVGHELASVPIFRQPSSVSQPSDKKTSPRHKPSEGYSKVAFTESDHQLMVELDVPEAVVRKLFKAIDSITGPIEFHGRVVDQHGEPVEGAKVAYQVVSSPGFGGPGEYTAITNGDGRFSVSGVRGIKILILEAKKPGYAINAFGRFRIRSKTPAELVSTYTADNPYVVKAWKLPESEPVWEGKNKRIYMIADGRTYSLQFENQQINIIEGKSNNAHLWVSMVADPDLAHYAQGNWSISIEAVDGGIQQAMDKFMYRAPDAGYEQRWNRSYTMGQPDYEDSLRRQKFYFVAQNKKLYGRLLVGISPFLYGGESGIAITYTINPQGSRNLYSGKLHGRR